MPVAIAAFAALSQETRLRILRVLVRAGPEGLPAGQIAEALEVPAATLSFHLSQLRAAGLIQQRRDSRSLIYSPRLDTVRELMRFLLEDCCQGRVPPGSASDCPEC